MPSAAASALTPASQAAKSPPHGVAEANAALAAGQASKPRHPAVRGRMRCPSAAARESVADMMSQRSAPRQGSRPRVMVSIGIEQFAENLGRNQDDRDR